MLGKDAPRTTALTPTQFAPRAVHVEDLPTDWGRRRIDLHSRLEIDGPSMLAELNADFCRRPAPSHA